MSCHIGLKCYHTEFIQDYVVSDSINIVQDKYKWASETVQTALITLLALHSRSLRKSAVYLEINLKTTFKTLSPRVKLHICATKASKLNL